MLKHRLWVKVCNVLIVFSLLCNLLPNLAVAASSKIKIGYTAIPGFQVMDKEETKTGYAYELLQNLASYGSWTYDYQGYDRGWSEILTKLGKGDVDIVLGVSKTKDREKEFDFSTKAIGHNAAVLLTKSTTDKYKQDEPVTYKDMRVGMVRGSVNNTVFEKYIQEKKVPFKPVYFDNYVELNQALEDGATVDAIVTGTIQDISNAKVLLQFNSAPVYIAVKKGNTKILQAVNQALDKSLSDKPGLLNELAAKYYHNGQLADLGLTAEEQNYINKLKSTGTPIKVLVKPDLAPLSYFDLAGKAQGIIPQLLAEVSKRTGLKFDFVPAIDRAEYEAKFRDDAIAIKADAGLTLNQAEKLNLRLSDSYLYMPYGELFLANNKARKTVALISGDAESASLVYKEFKPENIHEYPNLAAVLTALQQGQVDVFLNNTYALNKIVASNKDSKLQVRVLYGKSVPLAFAVKKEQPRELVTILNKALHNLGPNYIQSVVAANTLSLPQEPTVDVLASLKANMHAVGAAVAVLVILVLLLILALVQRSKLKKTKKLNAQYSEFITNLCLAHDSVAEIDPENKQIISYKIKDEKLSAIVKALPSAEELLNRFNPLDTKQFQTDTIPAILERVMKTCTQEEYILREKQKDGQYHWMSIMVQGVKKEASQHQRVCLLLKRNVEVTQSKEVAQREQLQTNLLEAQKAAQDKGTYLMSLAHEINLPLTTLTHTLENAKGQTSAENLQTIIADANISVQHLSEMVNDVLNMASIEKGHMEVENASFSLKEISSNLARMYYSQAKAKGIDFEVLLKDVDQEIVIGDKTRINQVLLNILSNAFKFTAQGGKIAFSIKQLDLHNKKVRMQFEITDTGLGIAQEDLEKIFEPFEQAGRVVGKNYGGSGLGLSISNQLTNMMNGSVKVESQVGQGSKFTVVIPFGFEAETHEEIDTAIVESNLRAIVVEDQKASGVALCNLLQKFGITTLLVEGGKEALETLASAQQDEQNFDFCFVDWQMPEMDGLETVMAINEMGIEPMRVVLLSDYNYVAIAKKIGSLNVTALLNKPVFKSDIIQLLKGENKDALHEENH